MNHGHAFSQYLTSESDSFPSVLGASLTLGFVSFALLIFKLTIGYRSSCEFSLASLSFFFLLSLMVVRASRFSFSYSISQSSGAVSKIETPTSRAAVFVERIFVGGQAWAWGSSSTASARERYKASEVLWAFYLYASCILNHFEKHYSPSLYTQPAL